MTSFSIRTGKEADAPAIASLINYEIRTGLAIWRYAERPVQDVRAMIEQRLAAGHGVYVSETNEKIVGWASYGDFRAGEGYALSMEHSVHIAPDYQRKGIARALMARLLDHADAAGVHAMVGGIDSTNEGSIALHAQLGFIEVGRMPEIGKKFDRWLTLVLMQRMAR